MEGSEFIFIRPERVAWIKARRAQGAWKEPQAVVNNLTRGFQTIVKAAGISHASLHDLRRACISRWARRMSSAVVKELAGHKDIKTTLKYYVSIRPEDLERAREVTAEALLVDPE